MNANQAVTIICNASEYTEEERMEALLLVMAHARAFDAAYDFAKKSQDGTIPYALLDSFKTMNEVMVKGFLPIMMQDIKKEKEKPVGRKRNREDRKFEM